MKISLTDQFLWDLYNFFEPLINNADIILRPRTPYQLTHRIFSERNPVFEKYKREMNSKKFSKLIYYLKRKNFLKVKNLEENKGMMITRRGIDKALKNRFKFDNFKLNKRKDGKWIMIIFDMPKKDSNKRNLMRNILQNLGYKIFQYSVWITPYDVSDKTEKLLKFYYLDKYVRIFLIEKI